MKELISGAIALISACIWGGVLIFEAINNCCYEASLWLTLGIVVFIISTILYVVWTKFGSKTPKEYYKLERRNKMLMDKLIQYKIKEGKTAESC